MDLDSIRNSYARWAPIYDATFGRVTHGGRNEAVTYINARGGRVLEVGVGTGLSLDVYDRALSITGVDYSHDMLRKARARVARGRLRHVKCLRQMDARELDFPEASFDTVAAMHVLSVVPEPERVMSEIVRVLRPAGQVVITNHFKHERGVWANLARVAAPLDTILGWHADFEIDRVLCRPCLRVVERRNLPPAGLMSLLVLEKSAESWV